MAADRERNEVEQSKGKRSRLDDDQRSGDPTIGCRADFSIQPGCVADGATVGGKPAHPYDAPGGVSTIGASLGALAAWLGSPSS